MAALKGAFIRLDNDLLGGLPIVVVFQFNPEKITRTPALPAATAASGGSSGQTDAQQQAVRPSETIGFTLRIDATDQLASSNPIAAASGILPTLSAIELLMVPKSSLGLDLFSLGGGAAPHQNPPSRLPLVLFFWGPFRILPVKLTRLSIDETRFDTKLNPVRADVTVEVQVLTPDQLTSEFGRGAYAYSEGVKEVMAALNLANAVEIGVSSALSFSL